MSDCIEILFASDSNVQQLQSATCFNPHIGTTLMSYKGGGKAAKNCLSVMGKDYLITADASQPIVNVWPLNSQEPSNELRMVLPGRPTALCISPDGYYCVCGINEKIYVWQTSNGVLMNVLTKHFQDINKILFLDDSSHFITAGKDGLILMWRLGDVVAKQFGDFYKLSASTSPIFCFSHHSLPITDIFVGHGNLKARLFTVSADQTCKIFCLNQGTLLLSIVFDYVLTAVTVNDLETDLFVGTNGGKILSFCLDPYPRSLEHNVSEETNINSFAGHAKSITCLSVSLDGVTLASGSEDEKIFLWNIPSQQLIRSFEMKGTVSNLFFYFAPSTIFLHKFEPSLIINKFEKVSQTEDKNLDINVWVHDDLTAVSLISELQAINRKEGFHIEKIRYEGDESLAELKQQISKLKYVNQQLYQFAMNKILRNPLGINKDVNGVENVKDS